jgi:hypothetical protein
VITMHWSALVAIVFGSLAIGMQFVKMMRGLD